MSASTPTVVPVFSYAQAAKGLAPTTPTQTASRNESPAASDKSAKDRPAQTASVQPASKPSPWRADQEEKNSIESTTSSSNPNTRDAGDKGSEPTHQDSDRVSQVEASAHLNGISSVQEAKHDAQQNESQSPLQNGRTNSSDGAQNSGTRANSTHSASDKKSKDAEDDWEKVSVPSIAAEKELKAAPLPTFNIWKQRQEAHAAKKKDTVEVQRNTVPTPATGSQQRKTEEHKRKPSTKDQQVGERESRGNEGFRTNGRKETTSTRSPRSVSQQAEGQIELDAPPTVGDSRSWPTPESSTPDERRKSSSYEKVDKPDAKLSVQKSHGKNWVPIPFVPSAKFETQLPPAAARRGGRGSNRGARDSGGRGSHSANVAEKQGEPSGLMGPPPVPKPSAEQDRGRKPEGQRGTRGVSVPNTAASTRLANGDEGTSSISHRPVAVDKDQGAVEATTNSFSTPAHARDQTPKTTLSSRSSSRHTGNAGNQAVDSTATQGDQAAAHGQTTDQSGRQSYSGDRFKGPGSTSGAARGNLDFNRDRGAPRNREWSREKPDSAREKVESWRDRENSNDQSSRREGRLERGGRGSYRGRGNHSYSSTFGPHTSPLPQNGFEPSRSTSQAEPRSRQSSQPFPPNQATSTPRPNPRSQSIPVQMMVPGYYGPGHNLPHGLAPLQTDGYGYPQMHMQPGIMSAMPYNDPLNQLALMSMVGTQIEYYFSIDNLCKDVFLRRNMDGQGWVPLSVIANFKRIKTLTEDNMSIDTLRYVCQTVRSVDFLPGVDGDDRLRRRDNWRDFVLPAEERFESARHDGPVNTPQQYVHSLSAEPPAFEGGFYPEQPRSPPAGRSISNGAFNTPLAPPYPSGHLVDHQVANGVFVAPAESTMVEEAHHPSVQTTETHIPEVLRSPPPPATPLHVAQINGHHRHSSRSDIEANVFPDENIPNINIRMQPRPSVTAGEPPALPSIARVVSNESINGRREVPDIGSTLEQTRIPSLRGGASSPKQLDQLRNISFGFTTGVPTTDENSVIYFTRDGHETHLPPPRPGEYDQTYLSLHDVAFQQKQAGVEGALEPLYSFWTDFLVDKFNAGMYEEFKTSALSEAQESNVSGMLHLIRYYTKILCGMMPISERVAIDMVSIARDEDTQDRALFQTLRAAWRNGATHMKTIKRLGDQFTAEEKAELDKSA